MPSLLEHLVESAGIEVEIATVSAEWKDDEFTDAGVKYFSLAQPKSPGIFFACRPKDLDACAALVRERTPDLVHIHGTERFYGLLAARKLIQTPCVISLQGLLGPYREVFFGDLSAAEIYKAHRLVEIVARRGLLRMYSDYGRASRYEREILAGAESFMGRTDWDRAHLRSVNSTASYYHAGEILRSAFAEERWYLSRCERHTVLFTKLGRAPYRGTELLLKAMRIVRREYPDMKLRLADELGTRRGYDRFLQRAIVEAGLSKNVELLGYLDGPSMAAALRRSHVFALASYADNSPNSLCEAMQVGVPCVATYVGGIPSLIEHRRTGLLTPRGDAPALADAIITLFRDDDLSMRLSDSARTEASERHAPERVLHQVLTAYEEVTFGRSSNRWPNAFSQSQPLKR